MGIGFALAAGLIQGFTNNIKRERARRDTDFNRLETISSNIAQQAALNPDLSQAQLDNIKYIQGMVSSKKEELERKPKIGLFGKETPRVRLEEADDIYAKLQPTRREEKNKQKDQVIEVTFSENVSFFDTNYKKDVQYKIPRSVYDTLGKVYGYSIFGKHGDSKEDTGGYKIKLSKDVFFTLNNDPNQNPIAFVNEVNQRSVSDPSFITLMKNNLNYYNLIKSQLDSSIAIIEKDLQKIRADATNLDEISKLIPVFNLNNFNNLNPDSKEPTVESNIGKNLFDNKDMAVFNIPDSTEIFGVPINENNKEGVKKILGNLNMKNIDGLSDSLNEKFYAKLIDANPDKKQRIFKATMEISKIVPNVNALDPDEGLTTSNEKTLAEIYKELQSLNLSDEELIYALAPFMSFKDQAMQMKPPVSGVGFQIQNTSSLTREQYALKKSNLNFKNFSELEDSLTNTNLLLNQLQELRKNRQNVEGETLGFEELKKFFKFNLSVAKDIFQASFVLFDGKSDTLSDIATGNGKDKNRRLRSGEFYIDDDSNEAKEFRKQLNDRIQSDDKFAKIEALTIALAFRLARAADPSGRLSNQDIQQQLVRLGDMQDLRGAALQKIDLLIDEVSHNRERLNIVKQFGKGDGNITQESAMLIDAATSYHILKTSFDSQKNFNLKAENIPYGDLNPENFNIKKTEYFSPKGNPIDIYIHKDTFQIVYADADGNRYRLDQLVKRDPNINTDKTVNKNTDETVNKNTDETEKLPSTNLNTIDASTDQYDFKVEGDKFRVLKKEDGTDLGLYEHVGEGIYEKLGTGV